MRGHESVQGLAHQGAGRIRGDEIPLVGDVLHVNVDAPTRLLVAEHGIEQDVSGHIVDVGDVAERLVAIIDARANPAGGGATVGNSRR